MKRIFVLSFFIFVFFVLHAAPIEFHLADVESWLGDPLNTPWIFDTDDPGYNTDDGDPFDGGSVLPFKNYAYRWFYSIDAENTTTGEGPTVVNCTAENLAYVDGVDGFDITFESYELSGFEKINTVNPGNPWDTLGEAGDKRVYTGGVGKVFLDGALVLQLNNCVLTAYVYYPTEAQMEVTTGVPGWQNDIGQGLPTEAEGWGVVDRVSSDANWIGTFADAANGDRVDFEMSTMDAVIQGEYGYYSFDLGFLPANNAVQQDNAVVPLVPVPGEIQFPDLDVDFNFANAAGGGVNGDLNNLDVFFHDVEPDGNLPVDILHVLPHYWEFNTTLETFTTTITFDLTGFASGNPANWQVLRRETQSDTWVEWGDYTSLGGNLIRANNVSAFSEWSVGTTEDTPLPITLASFGAQCINEENIISWSTYNEVNNQGWNLYRSTDLFEAGIKLNADGLILGAGTTNDLTNYEFIDSDDLVLNTSYNYWLESFSLSGDEVTYGPVTCITTQDDPINNTPDNDLYGLYQNHPNPFNPSTEITFMLAESAEVDLTIYDIKGRKITTLLKNQVQPANQINRIIWNGEDSNGQQVPSGIYFYQLNNGKNIETRRMLLVK